MPSALVDRQNKRFQINHDSTFQRIKDYKLRSLVLFGSSEDKSENAIDATIEDKNVTELSDVVDFENPVEPISTKQGFARKFVRQLANLSLMDYKWRSSVFNRSRADRQMEESVARMMGETATYVRPMDASDDTIGPLGQAERSAVSWLTNVIEEEGKRAKRIVEGDGSLVRPIESGQGPLAELEEKAVRFLKLISDAEKERMMLGKMRPMSLSPSKRGPLGEAEASFVNAFQAIKSTETFRLQESIKRGGAIVRPIDVPGPLGELELSVGVIMKAEQQRAEEAAKNNKNFIRPKDASFLGPLGEAEKELVTAIENLKDEERLRLANIKLSMEDNRPMDKERNSFLGVSEAFTVGLFRAPKLFASVIDRVQELMTSEMLSNAEQSEGGAQLDRKAEENEKGE